MSESTEDATRREAGREAVAHFRAAEAALARALDGEPDEETRALLRRNEEISAAIRLALLQRRGWE